MTARTRKLTSLAILSALAFLVMLLFKLVPIPIVGVSFLTFDPKDVVIAIGGLLYGPFSAFMMSLVVSIIEIPVSGTGIIGCVMNVLSTCAFACTAAFVYKRRQTLKMAVLGLVLGVVLMVGVMLLWNYFLTPLYMVGTSRKDVAAMLMPVFLPFNLIKGGINAALTMLVYKPLAGILRKAGLAPPRQAQQDGAAAPRGFRLSAGVVLVSLVVLASCVLLALSLNGVI